MAVLNALRGGTNERPGNKPGLFTHGTVRTQRQLMMSSYLKPATSPVTITGDTATADPFACRTPASFPTGDPGSRSIRAFFHA